MAGKTGFQYYSVETDRYQDIRIKRLKKECGCIGLAVYDYLLCEIYRVKGCFLEWDESTVFDVSEYLGLKETQVMEIVNYCCAVGLFDRGLLTSERVLTSSSIQSRFIDWSKKAKRSGIEIPEKLLILPEKLAKLPEERPKVPEGFIQSKVKESKVEKRKENAPAEFPEFTKPVENENSAPQTGGAPPLGNGPPFDDVHRYFRGIGGTEEMARKFFNKWEASDWMDGHRKITRWAAMANNFFINYNENEKRHGKGDSTNGSRTHGQSAGAIKLARSLADDLGFDGAGGTGNP